MSEAIAIDYAAIEELKADGPPPGGGTDEPWSVVVFADQNLAFGKAATAYLGKAGAELVKRAAAAAKFKGKFGSALDVVAPSGLSASRLLVVGVGGGGDKDAANGKDAKDKAPKETPATETPTKTSAKDDKGKPFEPTNLGGSVAGKLGRGTTAVVLFDLPNEVPDLTRAVADFAVGLRLRDYRFDQYKTKKKDDAEDDKGTRVTIAVADPKAVKEASEARDSIAAGVITARSLVNEPPNILYPEAFAERAKQLQALGLEVEILDMDAMRKLGMGAIVGVSQGSNHHGRIVIMRWNGAEKNGGEKNDGESRPVAFIGKGVTFDTGGISIKGSAGMEEMKGDMAGAACVVGLMQALAGRKAKVDAIGAIGLVENMPGPDAQRPGDIVTSMSGQTIEIINTDAEGRLVLADVCWYVQDKYKPQFMIDLATLTGAIIVALGQEHAGLFSNDDELADKILAAGKATGEKLWRMPLGPGYDKLIDSKFADVKNSGGRHAGSITAAQFIKRFVNDVPWAHLDIAGMGMSSPANDINQSWGSGWGVRLLDRLVADNYESA